MGLQRKTVEAAVCPIRESLRTLKVQVTSSLDALLEGEFTATAEALTKETRGVSSLYGHLFKTELPKLATKLDVNACLATLEACKNAQPPPTVTDHTATQAEPRVDKCPTDNHASPIAHKSQWLTTSLVNHLMTSPRAPATLKPPSASAMHGSMF